MNRPAFALLALSFALPARAADVRVAVLDLRSQTPELGQTLAELVAFELEETGGYRVLSRDALASALKLQGLQQTLGCETEACQAQLGRAAEVDQLVSGSVGRAGSRFIVVLRLLDVTSLGVVKQVKQLVPADEDALVDIIGKTARALLEKAPIARGEAKSEAPGAPELREREPHPEFGTRGYAGTGVGGAGGSGVGTIGLGTIGTIGHGSGRGYGSGSRLGGRNRPASRSAEVAITDASEAALGQRLKARMRQLRAKSK